jgi:SdrD B-like domain
MVFGVSKKRLLVPIVTLVALFTAGLAYANAGGGAALAVSIESQSTSVAAGSRWDYSIGYSCVSSTERCTDASIILTLPFAATIESLPQITSGRGTVERSGSVVTVKFGDDLPNTTGVLAVTMSVPSCLNVGDRQPGALEASAAISGNNATGSRAVAPTVTVATIPDCPTDPDGPTGCTANCPFDPSSPHIKSGNDAMPGGIIWWNLNIAARATETMVEDEIPTGLVVHDIVDYSGSAQLIEVFCGGRWYRIGASLRSQADPACQEGNLPSWQYSRFPKITRVRLRVPATLGASVSIATYVPKTAVAGSDITNCATVASEKVCDTVKVLEVRSLPNPRIRLVGSPEQPLNGTRLFGSSTIEGVEAKPSRRMSRRDLAFSAGLRIDRSSLVDLVNPVLAVELSPEHTFVSAGRAGNWQDTYASSVNDAYREADDPRSQPGCMSPSFSVRIIGGTEYLIWKFDNCILKHDTQFDQVIGANFSTRLKAGVLATTQVQAYLQVGFAAAPTEVPFSDEDCSSAPIDQFDLDSDGSTSDQLCNGWSDYYTMPTHAELSASTSVMGSEDDRPTQYPLYGSTNAAGEAVITVEFENTGTIGIKDTDVVGVLPFVGDDSLGAGQGSAWDMELEDIAMTRIEADNSERSVPAAEVEVGYSESTNPCRLSGSVIPRLNLVGGVFGSTPAQLASVPGPAGCQVDDWNDPKLGARSWALRFKPADELLPGERLRVVVKVRRRLASGAPAPGIAWSTVQYSGTTSADSRLLTSRPRVGGVSIVDSTQTKLLGLVWDDANKDGFRDATEQPLAGVVVSAYEDGANTPPIVALTTATGSYEISGLNRSRTYTLRFAGGFPGASKVTIQDAPNPTTGTNDDTRDSDAVADTLVPLVAVIRSVPLNNARVVNSGWDVGIIVVGDEGPDLRVT